MMIASPFSPSPCCAILSQSCQPFVYPPSFDMSDAAGWPWNVEDEKGTENAGGFKEKDKKLQNLFHKQSIDWLCGTFICWFGIATISSSLIMTLECNYWRVLLVSFFSSHNTPAVACIPSADMQKWPLDDRRW